MKSFQLRQPRRRLNLQHIIEFAHKYSSVTAGDASIAAPRRIFRSTTSASAASLETTLPRIY